MPPSEYTVHLAQIDLQLSEQEERVYSVNSARMALLSSSIRNYSLFYYDSAL